MESKHRLVSLGRVPVNSLKVGQMIRFHSRACLQETVLTISRIHWMKDKALLSGAEANDVALEVHDWVELVREEEDENEERKNA